MVSAMEKTRRGGKASKARWLADHVAWFAKVSQGNTEQTPTDARGWLFGNLQERHFK